MKNCKLSKDEQQRRKELATHVREMICEQMPVEAQDETSLMMGYRDYYLQISFSDLHPLMVFCLAKALIKPSTVKQQRIANDLNLRSILGSHAINEEVGCYSYRATHWLDTEMEPERFFEILNRCVDEANKGFLKITIEEPPKTGDNSNMGLWFGLLMLSCLGMVGTVIYGRRRRREDAEV